ncbi:MAG TPA: hypothetical protein PL033_20880 [Candidatus Brocadiia bacterium]|nr:hypothetical protein [Candidatus Brocadiia bacterium]
MDDDLSELMDAVRKPYVARFTGLVALIDAFCDAHLTVEYRRLCREMAVAV